jgi:hypothetical protein
MKKSMIVNDILAMGDGCTSSDLLLRQVEAKNAQTNEAATSYGICKPILLLEKWNSIPSTLIVVKGAQAQTVLSK